MAKRSPILGYNHNVRYRGLIFHVQTEDSGVLSPHLFTHLFHSGVIVSTRKLVYDSGSDEGAIKSLMQAQHKAVMKDLKKGTFDEKIDQYLGGTPGLLPRGAVSDESQPAEPLRDSQPALARPSDPGIPTPGEEVDRPSEPVIVLEPGSDPEIDINATIRTPMIDPASAPVDLKARTKTDPSAKPPEGDDIALGHFQPTPAQQPHAAPRAWMDDPADSNPRRDPTRPPGNMAARTRTADRGSGPSSVRGADDDGGAAVAAAIAAAQANATIRTPMPQMPPPREFDPEVLQLDLEDAEEEQPQQPARGRRDTDIVLPADEQTSDGVPGFTTAPRETPRPRSVPGESVPPLPPPPPASRHAASALPPARPITRPPARPAITPPQVVSRPITRDKDDDRPRNHGDSDAIEVYAPAPPSADTPPGIPERERPGQYAQHKRVSQKVPAIEMPSRERSGGVPIPPGLGRPGNNRIPTGQNPQVSRPTPQTPPAVPQQVRGEASSGRATPRPRTPTPSRSSPSPSNRSGTNSQPQPQPNSGVVMTRPAVIVGAPAKPAQPARVRKAREDEGRGFGQGLISEKSLDEVILAYLSEDADDK